MSPPRPAANNLLPNQPKQQIVRQQPDDERNPKPWTFESDMSLTPAQMRAIKMDILRRRIGVPIRTRKIVADGRYYWPNAVIPYETRSLGKFYEQLKKPVFFIIFLYSNFANIITSTSITLTFTIKTLRFILYFSLFLAYIRFPSKWFIVIKERIWKFHLFP